MKRIFTLAFVFFSLLITAGVISSCDFDVHEDPDYPLYVEYTISAGDISFSGPEQLKIDNQAWIDKNRIVYTKHVNYKTGDPSEFTTTDNEAIKKYQEEFLPKFKAHLQQVTAELDKGTYGKNVQVKATFYVFAKRGQGQGGDLKYEHIEYTYPQ